MVRRFSCLREEAFGIATSSEIRVRECFGNRAPDIGAVIPIEEY